jgi:hypothetical protein
MAAEISLRGAATSSSTMTHELRLSITNLTIAMTAVRGRGVVLVLVLVLRGVLHAGLWIGASTGTPSRHVPSRKYTCNARSRL